MLLAFLPDVQAQALNAGVSPPNFELRANPGDVVREVLTIINTDATVGDYLVRTTDWGLDENSGVILKPEVLEPGSCRPWTRIERRRIKLSPSSTKKYRFEVHVPADAEAGECRFSILITPAPPQQAIDKSDGPSFALKFPIRAQIAVIVYVTIGDAAPNLAFQGARLKSVSGKLQPVVTFSNNGNAHGRPFGNVIAVDAQNNRLELVVVPFPVLPNRSEDILLRADPNLNPDPIPSLVPPIHLKGEIEYEGGVHQLDAIVE